MDAAERVIATVSAERQRIVRNAKDAEGAGPGLQQPADLDLREATTSQSILYKTLYALHTFVQAAVLRLRMKLGVHNAHATMLRRRDRQVRRARAACARPGARAVRAVKRSPGPEPPPPPHAHRRHAAPPPPPSSVSFVYLVHMTIPTSGCFECPGVPNDVCPQIPMPHSCPPPPFPRWIRWDTAKDKGPVPAARCCVRCRWIGNAAEDDAWPSS